jgi:hypothetical protein
MTLKQIMLSEIGQRQKNKCSHVESKIVELTKVESRMQVTRGWKRRVDGKRR